MSELSNLNKYKQIIEVVNELEKMGIASLEIYNPFGREFRVNVDKMQIKLTQAINSIGSEDGLLELQFGGMTIKEESRYGKRIGKLTVKEAVERISQCYHRQSMYYQDPEFTLIEEFKEKMNKMRQEFVTINKGELHIYFEYNVIMVKDEECYLNVYWHGNAVSQSNSAGKTFHFIHTFIKNWKLEFLS